MNALVEVKGLRVVAKAADGGENEIVKGVDFSLGQGEVLALIGESGSGKTTIALSLLGYAREGCRLSGGSVRVGQTQVLGLSAQQLHRFRGRHVAYIAQSAAAAFNPSKRLMDQVIEPALIHGLLSRREAQQRAVELFVALALPDPERIGRRYPHQVSGGQLQRVMAAMALITDPQLVILDEPTTALDVTTQIEVLRTFKQVMKERGISAVYVSHDLAVVAQMADHILVLKAGAVREHRSTEALLIAPSDSYTRQLLQAARPDMPDLTPFVTPPRPALLQVRNLVAGYGAPDHLGLPSIRVLDDININLYTGQSIGIIGESGSGKSTLARAIAGLLSPARGKLVFDGATLPGAMADRTPEQFRRIQLVHQNADTALNPAHSVAQILCRPLKIYHGMNRAQQQQRLAQLLDLVQLPQALAQRYPSELSGGQKQRVNLARALAADPAVVLCDEVTSALDTVVGAAIIELLKQLRRELGLSYLFISHDISTVKALCDEVVVLYAGHQVETGNRQTLSQQPLHPYTDLLTRSVPQLRRHWLEEQPPAGSALAPIANLDRHPELCTFLSRCPVRIAGVCDATAPSLKRLAQGNEILCHHRAEDLIRLQSIPHAMPCGEAV
ncbi:ABC transporter ATP-binding protein [Pseudomonas sp. dw_358]|uniref:ABC transporter ATP-binding protein n=1 Tax=Pseudomonas sp. dw_358 TaxID=2720083 RepID=UPI001BD67787|nr:ABC transporter ATP-binding protein [Pseudomonas sp. dw_358]